MYIVRKKDHVERVNICESVINPRHKMCNHIGNMSSNLTFVQDVGEL